MALNQMEIRISRATVDRTLRSFHYSFKRVTLVHINRNTPSVIERRFEYAVQYNEMMVEKEKIFFLDETGVQIWLIATYFRSLKGVSATKRFKSMRSKNYSISTAMNTESLYFFEIQNKPIHKNYY
jgi:hypothetical protein